MGCRIFHRLVSLKASRNTGTGESFFGVKHPSCENADLVALYCMAQFTQDAEHLQHAHFRGRGFTQLANIEGFAGKCASAISATKTEVAKAKQVRLVSVKAEHPNHPSRSHVLFPDMAVEVPDCQLHILCTLNANAIVA